jgi:hypothetical protein
MNFIIAVALTLEILLDYTEYLHGLLYWLKMPHLCHLQQYYLLILFDKMVNKFSKCLSFYCTLESMKINLFERRNLFKRHVKRVTGFPHSYVAYPI